MKERHNGFTVVEMAVVLAVIAILAAVSIPAFSEIAKRSDKSNDMELIARVNAILADESSFESDPKNYNELMELLGRYDLCSKDNQYMFSGQISQEELYLVWYPESNCVAFSEYNADELKDMAVEGEVNYFDSGEDPENAEERYFVVISTQTCGDKGDFARWYRGELDESSISDPLFRYMINEARVPDVSG